MVILLESGVMEVILTQIFLSSLVSERTFAEDEVILPPSRMIGAERWIPDLERKTIADCGHWTQQEKPGELNAIMIDWLTRKLKS